MSRERFWARVEKASETPKKSATAAHAHLVACPNRPMDHHVDGTCSECHFASCVLERLGEALPAGPTEPSAVEVEALRVARATVARLVARGGP